MEKIIKILNKRKRTSANINANDNQMERIKKQIDELEEETRNNFERTNGYKQNVSSLSTNISNISTDVSNLSTTVNTLSGNLNTLSGNFSSHVADANQRISNVVGTLADHGTHIMSAEADIIDLQNGKQDALTAGSGISITTNNNVTTISATGGSGGLSSVTAGDVDSESATSGQVLTADGNGGASWQNASGGSSCNCASDIATLQTQVASLQSYVNNFDSMLNDRNAIYNTSYEEIDQNAVVRTYDCMDKQYNYSGTGTFNSAPFTFCVASGTTTAKLKITLKIKGTTTAGTGVLGLYLNSNSLTTTQTFTYDAELDFKEVIFDLSLSQQGNVIYFTVNSTNNTNFEISYAKAELYNCTNPTFMNKIKKYDVQYFNNIYYITNCTGKTAKYCIIHENDLTSAQDITWIDTNIEAQFMTFCGKITQQSSTYVVTEVNKAYLLQDNTLFFETSLGNYTVNAYNFGYACCHLPSTYLAWLTTNYESGSQLCNYRYAISASNAINVYNYSSTSAYSHIVGSKRNSAQYVNPSNFYYLAQNLDGTVLLRYSSARSYNLGYGVAMGSYIQNDAYKVYNIYVKVYDKMIRYNITYTTSSPYFTINSSEEIGFYDDYFEGANNDYFVVKDGKLLYYKNQI